MYPDYTLFMFNAAKINPKRTEKFALRISFLFTSDLGLAPSGINAIKNCSFTYLPLSTYHIGCADTDRKTWQHW